MTTYSDVFGGANIYPSEVSYSSLNLTQDVGLSWPDETSSTGPFATRIIDLTSTFSGLSVVLPDASKSGVGETILFNNIGSNPVTVKDFSGTQVLLASSGTVWQVYLSSNTTTAGVWKSLQYGSSVSTASASSLVGNGIIASGTSLQQAVPVLSLNSNYSASGADRARLLLWVGAGGVLTLPIPPANDWFCYVRNSGYNPVSLRL